MSRNIQTSGRWTRSFSSCLWACFITQNEANFSKVGRNNVVLPRPLTQSLVSRTSLQVATEETEKDIKNKQLR